MTRYQKLSGIVLKRNNFRDADRFITLYSLESGKIDLLAKGIRKLSSKKRSLLEVGNHVSLQYIQTHSSPIITQVSLLNSFPQAKQSLHHITLLYQFLEIIDLLTVEANHQPEIYFMAIDLLTNLEKNHNHKQQILQTTASLLELLGFGTPTDKSESALHQHLLEVIQKPLRTKAFLTSSF